MTEFNGKYFLRAIEELDPASQEYFARHGTVADGRWTFVESIVDEVMLRMADTHLDDSNVKGR